MTGRKRNWRPDTFYHVVVRGNNREDIFKTTEDMYHFMRILNHAHRSFEFSIAAYCIMTNHYHLLISSKDDLSKIMQQINRRYSDYYAKYYNHVGRIYQRRYFSKAVRGSKNLLAVSRYIHRNPIETKVPMVDDLLNYPFSSFSYYQTEQIAAVPFLDLKTLPLLLKPPFKKTTSSYIEYCVTELKEETQIAAFL